MTGNRLTHLLALALVAVFLTVRVRECHQTVNPWYHSQYNAVSGCWSFKAGIIKDPNDPYEVHEEFKGTSTTKLKVGQVYTLEKVGKETWKVQEAN